jgi:FPC/CPF motif-containing protein YcgG
MVSDVAMAFLPLVILFVGLYVFVKVSDFRQSQTRETIDPHVVKQIDRYYGDKIHTIHKCEYCDKERERKEYFLQEDCEGFEANS